MTFQKTWLDLGSEGVEEPRRLDVSWMSLRKVLGSRNGGGGQVSVLGPLVPSL